MMATGGGVELCSLEEFIGLSDEGGHQWTKVFNACGINFDEFGNATSDGKDIRQFTAEEAVERAIKRVSNSNPLAHL